MTAHAHTDPAPPLKPGVLRDFESFSSALTRTLSGLPGRIVRELYAAAMMKAWLDNGLIHAQQNTRTLRQTRKRLTQLHALIRKALKVLEPVNTCDFIKLEIPERFRAKRGYDELSKIRQQLKELSDEVAGAECIYAALIHPKLRTSREKRLVSQDSSLFRNISAPVWREKSPQIDHMFIGQIAACLEKLDIETSLRPNGRGKKLSTSASFFRQVFEAAFGVIKQEGAIAKELERQRNHGREFLIEPDDLTPYPELRIPFGFFLLRMTE
jgi:hypothetical protein